MHLRCTFFCPALRAADDPSHIAVESKKAPPMVAARGLFNRDAAREPK